MRKLLFFILAVATGILSGNAQLYILNTGNVRIGNDTTIRAPGAALHTVSDPPSADDQLPPPNTASYSITPIDSVSSLVILGEGLNSSGAYLTFGNINNVGIGEYKLSSTSTADTDMLDLFGKSGLVYRAGEDIVISYKKSQGMLSPSMTFYCDLKAPSFVVSSDARLKRDVNGLDGFGKSLEAISPVSYVLDSPKASPSVEANKDFAGAETSKPAQISDRVRFGFIAQEVREVFPELVIEDEDGYLGIDYIGFIPILVDAYKNLREKVSEQEETISRLTNNGEERRLVAGVDAIGKERAVLLQNRPNPFRESTSIMCAIPETVTEAYICIYDLQGKQISRMTIDGRGECSISIDGSTLQPGMYIYTLITDGMEIDSKRMILTD